jgi:uncharacterized protein (DUF2236 family)
MAATLVLAFYPPVMVPLAREWQDSGRPPDPCRRLIPRWLTAVTGTPAEVERLRRRAAAAHARVHGEMPAEVDAARFDTSYAATDPVAMTAMYVVITSRMLAAQELLYRRLDDDAERDLYCSLTGVTAGYAFGLHAPPTTFARLREAYQGILAHSLQDTDLGRQMLRDLLAADISGTPGAELAVRAAPLLDCRVTGLLGPLLKSGAVTGMGGSTGTTGRSG